MKTDDKDTKVEPPSEGESSKEKEGESSKAEPQPSTSSTNDGEGEAQDAAKDALFEVCCLICHDETDLMNIFFSQRWK